MSSPLFVLGGDDLEMNAIKAVLQQHDLPFIQPQTYWGNVLIEPYQVSSYHHRPLVLIECAPSPSLSRPVTVIDHHTHHWRRPASLLQLLQRLNQPPNQKQRLIASLDDYFIGPTIRRWPTQTNKIKQLWLTNYQQKFANPSQWRNFAVFCQQLYHRAYTTAADLVMIDNAPASVQYLAFLADLDGRRLALTRASRRQTQPTNCFLLTESNQIAYLTKLNLPQAYWGKRYFHCRLPAKQWFTLVQHLPPLTQQSTNTSPNNATYKTQ